MNSVTYRLIVVELDDVISRREPSKPNLFVDLIKVDPEDRFASMRVSKKRWYSGYVVRLRYDLAPQTHFSTEHRADDAHKKLVKKLKGQGYTVNRDPMVWHVYVVELDKSAVADPGKGYVYVGETSKTPEERFIEHTTGKRNQRGPLYSSVVLRHGVRLRPDLAPRRVYFDSASSKRAEKETYDRLEAKGYKVRGGH
jgi:hypothetical protein